MVRKEGNIEGLNERTMKEAKVVKRKKQEKYLNHLHTKDIIL
jgi:hypothetical protein